MKLLLNNTKLVFKNSPEISFSVGGYDSANKVWNSDTNYLHSNFIPTTSPFFLNTFARFVVFSNDGVNCVDETGNGVLLNLMDAKFSTYPYASVVLYKISYDALDGNIIIYPETNEITWCYSGMDKPTGSTNANTNYSCSQILNAVGLKLYKDGVKVQNLGAGASVYYNANKEVIGTADGSVDYTLLAQAAYFRFSVYETDPDVLATYSIEYSDE